MISLFPTWWEDITSFVEIMSFAYRLGVYIDGIVEMLQYISKDLEYRPTSMRTLQCLIASYQYPTRVLAV